MNTPGEDVQKLPGMAAPKMEGAQVSGAAKQIEDEIAQLLKGAEGTLSQ